jgi:hypothetical protein
MLADMLTSLAPSFYLLEAAGCFYVSGSFLVQNTTLPGADPCGSLSINYIYVQPLILSMPYWIRMMQCVYLACTNRHLGLKWGFVGHVVNAGKYFSAIATVIASAPYTAFANYHNASAANAWRWVWIVTLIVKSLYSYIWDVKLDFDLGQLPLKWHWKHGHLEWVHLVADNTPLHQPSTAFPPLLRPTRLYSFTAGYYMILVFDLLARGSWAFAISVNGLPPLWSPLMALVEVIRRGLWMLLRTEHELVVLLKQTIPSAATPDASPSGTPRAAAAEPVGTMPADT